MGFRRNRAVACELFSAGVCNIECNYCYIPKVQKMKEVHKAIVAKIESGEYIEDLYKVYGKNLEHLSFWGTEPTLTLRYIKNILPQIFEKFPHLKSFSWSSNFITRMDDVVEFIKAIPKDKCINIDFQASLDGPTEITDKNRSPGATKKIVENIFWLASALKKIDLGNNTVTISSKPTWDINNMKYYLEDPKRMYDYYKFFDPLIEVLQSSARVNPKVQNHFSSGFSLMVPGLYSVEDGKLFAKTIELMMQIEKENEEKHLFRYSGAPFNTYESRLKRLFTYGNELHNKLDMFTCSGGDSNWSLDERGFIHICHRSLFLNNSDYVDQVMANDEIKKWGVSVFDKGSINIAASKYVVDSRNQEDIDRFDYVMNGYHSMQQLKLSYGLSMIKELVAAGQMSPRYEKDKSLAFTFVVFVNTGLSCPMENVLNTGNVHLQPVSLFRLFGNGAFELTFDTLLNRYKKERVKLHAVELSTR